VRDQLQTLFPEFAKLLQGKSDYVELFACFGANSEGWLQGELLHFLALNQAVEELRPQRRGLDPGKRESCDFWIKLTDCAVWCEIKSFCTNYCGSPGKNITDRIGGILGAMGRVAAYAQADGSRAVVIALVYPFADGEAEKKAWDKHWQRLLIGPLTEWQEHKIRFHAAPEKFARLILWSQAGA
jgi:hypothetical protein